MFDPYQQWLGLSPQNGPPTPFQLVGLDPGAYTAPEIQSAAERQMQLIRKHQSGPHGGRVLKLIGEILEARDVLLDPIQQKNWMPVGSTASAAVPVPTDDKAWYQDDKPRVEANPSPKLEIAAPDLSEAKTGWWAEGETAPSEAIPAQPKNAWWVHPEAKELEAVVEPPPPSSRGPRELEPEPATKQAVEPISPETKHRSRKKTLILGGLVTALIGVGVVVLVVNPKKSKTNLNLPPKNDVVLNTKPGPVKSGDIAKEKEIEKDKPKTVELPKKMVEKKAPFAEIREPRNYRLHNGAVWGLAVNRDGTEFFSVGLDKQLFARGLDEAKSKKKYDFLEGGLQVAFGSVGNVLTACDGAQIVVFDPDADKPRRKISSPSGGFRCFALHPDGVLVLSGSSDGVVRWWNVRDDKLETSLTLPPGREVSAVAISPDGLLAIAGTVEGKLFFIDTATRTVIHTLKEHAKKITAVAISPDGKSGVTVGEDKQIQLYDLTRKALLKKLDPQPDVILGVGWSSDSRRVLTCGLDPNVRLLDAVTGKPLWSSPLTEKAFALAIDPLDRFVLLGGEQGTIQLIPLPRFSAEDTSKEVLVQLPAERLPTPNPDEVKLARIKVREKYAADFERRQPAEIVALVEKLLRQALTVQHDPTTRQAFFDEVAELTQFNLMLDDALKVVDGRAKWFLSDDLNEKTQAVEYIAGKAPNPMQRAIAERAIELLLMTQRANRYDLAERFLKVAEDSARFSGVKETIDRVALAKKQLQGVLLQRSRVAQAKSKLQSAPDDPEANFLVGRSLCLVDGAWATGLPHLVKGNDDKWKALASLDLSDPKDGTVRFKLGGQWFDIAATVSEDEKAYAFARAKLWYERALEAGLTGIDKLDAQAKLRKIK